MKVVRKIVQIDEEKCDGCGQCVLACAEGSLEIIDGKAKVISDHLCDGLGACIGECPQDALQIIEREADEFDEEAVEKHLAGRAAPPKDRVITGGCPSAQVQHVKAATAPVSSAAPAQPRPSALGHWPVQINLVPPTAPFLKGAHLLVLADCVPVAFPSLHSDFLEGKAVMMGCPKFDDVQSYIDKFEQVFRTAGIKSITTVVMEVPCCSGLPVIVKKALDASGESIPVQEVVISTRGEIIKRIG
jgi:Fe-S-cluster-containing hydrogenase component 2